MMPKSRIQDTKKKADLPFLVVIRYKPENLLFGFPTRRQRDGFLEGLQVKWPHLEYVTSEVPGTEERT